MSLLSTKESFVSFGATFLNDHAGRMITDPRIALVELVANSWDAGADQVKIKWPKDAIPDQIKIEDNGVGITKEQFYHRWRQLNYNRRSSQGDDVEFPLDNRTSHRKAFGRNGKGRHSMFCFASKYVVETWRDGLASIFEVAQTEFASSSPFQISYKDGFQKDGHGTIISADLARNHIKIQELRELLGSKFVTDPSFEIYVNGKVVELTNLEHLTDKVTLLVPDVGEVTVSLINTKESSRTSSPHGVAWWVNKRLVGEPSWQGFNESSFVDRRTKNAKRLTFVVEADLLEKSVLDDWGGFRQTKEFQAVRQAVENHINSRVREFLQDTHIENKRFALENNRSNLQILPKQAQYFIGKAIDGIQNEMPNIQPNVLSATVSVLSNLEATRSGYSLLEQLARLNPDELDKLDEILKKWDIQDAQIILDELEQRLHLINRLEILVDQHNSDELHDIHPLFDRGLWMFGPEYESVEFRSNRGLLTVIRDLLKDDKIKYEDLSNPRRRPDIVALPNSSISLYARDSYADNAEEMNGIDKILIIELKKGGYEITRKEKRQGEDYAHELKKSGKAQNHTKITVFVLGSNISQDIQDDTEEGNVTVKARAYSTILRQAHARTFHLLDKLKQFHDSQQLTDPLVEEIITNKNQLQLVFK